MSQEERAPAELPLGLHAVISVRAAPVLVLRPEPFALTFEQLELSSVPVQGACENLIEKLDCRIDWKFKTDLLGDEPRTVSHPRPTELVPDGKSFKVVEKGKGSIALSIFDIGLVGTGKLGYSITPSILGAKSFELDLEKTKFRVELPIGISVSDRSARIGSKVDLKLEGAPCFSTCAVYLTIGEDTAPGDRNVEVERDWLPADAAAKAARSWWVGRTVDEETASGPPRLAYSGGKATHVFLARMKISEAAQLPPGSKPGRSRSTPRHIQVPPRPLLEVPHPRLESFELALQGGGVLEKAHTLSIEGCFSGFDDALSFGLEVNLFAHGEGPGWPRPFWELANDPLMLHPPKDACIAPGPLEDAGLFCSASMPKGAAWVAASKFEADLFDLRTLKTEALEELTRCGVSLFAEVGFPAGTAATGGNRRPVFAALASYGAAMGAPESSHAEEPWFAQGWAWVKAAFAPATFVPFTAGHFSWPAIATGVCSNLIDLSGKHQSLRAPTPEVLPSEWDEYVLFVATIAGEALDGSPKAWKGVAQTILNRVGRYDWGAKGYNSVTLVIRKSGYEAYDRRNESQPYQDAKRFLSGQPVLREKNLAALRKLVPVVTPLFLGTEKDESDAVLFCNPGMVSPAVIAPHQNKVVDCTDAVLGSPPNPSDAGRFVFLAYKQRAPRFNRRG